MILTCGRAVLWVLWGENGAGKSTMTKVSVWHVSKDEGQIFSMVGELLQPKRRLENGVAMVHQELNQRL